jgi:hypothetical protein
VSTAVKTRFGTVDAAALETLQDSFDTRRLLDAVEAIDQIRYRIDGLRDDLLDLHKMAAEVINEDPDGWTEREEPIWSMAEILASEILEFTTGLEQAYETLEQLETLIPGEDDWDDERDGQKPAEDEPEG